MLFFRRYSIATPSLLHRYSIVSPSFRWRSDGHAMEMLRRKSNPKDLFLDIPDLSIM